MLAWSFHKYAHSLHTFITSFHCYSIALFCVLLCPLQNSCRLHKNFTIFSIRKLYRFISQLYFIHFFLSNRYVELYDNKFIYRTICLVGVHFSLHRRFGSYINKQLLFRLDNNSILHLVSQQKLLHCVYLLSKSAARVTFAKITILSLFLRHDK